MWSKSAVPWSHSIVLLAPHVSLCGAAGDYTRLHRLPFAGASDRSAPTPTYDRYVWVNIIRTTPDSLKFLLQIYSNDYELYTIVILNIIWNTNNIDKISKIYLCCMHHLFQFINNATFLSYYQFLIFCVINLSDKVMFQWIVFSWLVFYGKFVGALYPLIK